MKITAKISSSLTVEIDCGDVAIIKTTPSGTTPVAYLNKNEAVDLVEFIRRNFLFDI